VFIFVTVSALLVLHVLETASCMALGAVDLGVLAFEFISLVLGRGVIEGEFFPCRGRVATLAGPARVIPLVLVLVAVETAGLL